MPEVKLTPGMTQSEIDQRLHGLYRSLQVELDSAGQLSALDSLALVQLIDQIESEFSIRMTLVDMDPRLMNQHQYLVETIGKYAGGSRGGS